MPFERVAAVSAARGGERFINNTTNSQTCKTLKTCFKSKFM